MAIVPFVRDQIIGPDPFNQAACLRAIRTGTFCNNNSDRHTMRIDGQMSLSVEPKLVLMSLVEIAYQRSGGRFTQG